MLFFDEKIYSLLYNNINEGVFFMTKKDNNIKFKLKKEYILPGIFLGLFIIWSILVLTGVTNKIDQFIESLVIGIRSERFTKVMTNFTNLGGGYALAVICILLFFFIKNKKIPLSITINLVTVFITSQLFKAIFRRPRPNGILLGSATGYSYPSGHTMVSFAFYIYILYLLCKKINNKLVRLLLIIFTTLLLTLIAFSRIYLGVHYFSDIMGGLLLGTSYIFIFININKRGETK